MGKQLKFYRNQQRLNAKLFVNSFLVFLLHNLDAKAIITHIPSICVWQFFYGLRTRLVEKLIQELN